MARQGNKRFAFESIGKYYALTLSLKEFLRLKLPRSKWLAVKQITDPVFRRFLRTVIIASHEKRAILNGDSDLVTSISDV